MKKIALVLLLILSITACGYITGTVQRAERSSVMFSGNLEGVSVQIDDLEPFAPLYRTHYHIPPGKHTLMAYRHGELVVKRVIYLENQVTTEVYVP
jgi:hypothetical protein